VCNLKQMAFLFRQHISNWDTIVESSMVSMKQNQGDLEVICSDCKLYILILVK
jgi:hypothetical protein